MHLERPRSATLARDRCTVPMTRIRGSYPGGPRRGTDAVGEERAEGAPRIGRVEQLEERLERASRGRVHRQRSRRRWKGLALALLVGGGIGLFLGYRSHQSSEDITDARNATRQRPMFDQTQETNRVLLELWRMEDVEKQPAPP